MLQLIMTFEIVLFTALICFFHGPIVFLPTIFVYFFLKQNYLDIVNKGDMKKQ